MPLKAVSRDKAAQYARADIRRNRGSRQRSVDVSKRPNFDYQPCFVT